MKGLPGSGKTTKALELLKVGNTVRINKDLLRTMLHGDVFNGRNEGLTQDASRVLTEYFLKKGINVIDDNTNLNPDTVSRLKNLALSNDAKIEYQDLTNESWEQCMMRDYGREKRVGKNVILKMALQYLEAWKGEEVIICDLDGTLCNIDHRLHFAKSEPKDWKSFFEGIPHDSIKKDTVEKIAKLMREHIGIRLIFVSARPETYRAVTEAWLEKNFDYTYCALIMREANDKREDSVVKKEIYDKYLKNLKITKVFDDRPRVIRMWKELGLEVEDCGNGVDF